MTDGDRQAGSWRDALKLLRSTPPGERFERFGRWQRERVGLWRRLLLRVAALLFLLIGLALLVLPGPGMLFVILSLALLSADIPALSRSLDRSELWLRHRWKSR